MVATSLLSCFPLSSCGRKTVGEAWGDGGSHKGRLRRAAAECVLPSESLCGEDGGFRKGGEVGGGSSR